MNPPPTGYVGGSVVDGHTGDSSVSFVSFPDYQMRYDCSDGPDVDNLDGYIFQNYIEVSFWNIHHYFLG